MSIETDHNHFLKSVHFIDHNTGWVLGVGDAHGLIYVSTDGGTNWRKQPGRFTNSLTSVFFIDRITGWVSGNLGSIYKTTNTGETWSSYSIGSNHYIDDVYFADSNTGWAISYPGEIWKSTNGGINWTNQYSETTENFSKIQFINVNTGWIIGSTGGIPGLVIKTTNGGANWFRQLQLFVPERLNSFQFLNENTGWVVGSKILSTTNGGANWYEKSSAGFALDVHFVNKDTGWITGCGSASGIKKTTNGGDNWTNEIILPYNCLYSVFFIDDNIGWAVGQHGGDGKPMIFKRVGSHDVGVTSIEPAPESNSYIECNGSDTIYPKATIKNFGIDVDSFFDIYYEIRLGDNLIYSGQRQDTLGSGQTRTINFDPCIIQASSGGDPEKYQIRSWIHLLTDSNSTNNVIVSSVTASNPDYSYSEISNYYFLNSSTNMGCIPEQSFYNWEDTTGSISLIVNGQPVVPYTEYNSFYFCGSFRLPDVLPAGKKFKFFNSFYDTIIIANNGVIGFGGASLSRMNIPTPIAIPSVNAPRPAIFPLWYWVNFQDPEITGRNLKYKITNDKFIVTYDRAPLYNAVIDANDYVTYQVILYTDFDGAPENGKIKVQYNYDNSGSTFINHYNTNALNAMTVGIQDSTGSIGLQYRRSETNSSLTVPGPLFGSPLAVEFAPINGVLPIELQSFTSSVSENDVSLSWVVNSQTNNSGFEIERSIVHVSNSPGWIKVGYVSGDGTSTTVKQFSFDDKKLSTGKYKYRLKQIDFNGSFNYYELQNEVEIGVPGKFELSQNYPNPFNPKTTIDFNIPSDMKVTLKIFDVSGREIISPVNEFKTAGYYSINFDGSNLSSGIYFYTLKAGSFSITKKFVILK